MKISYNELARTPERVVQAYWWTMAGESDAQRDQQRWEKRETRKARA